jgi:hypothetical protein
MDLISSSVENVNEQNLHEVVFFCCWRFVCFGKIDGSFFSYSANV